MSTSPSRSHLHRGTIRYSAGWVLIRINIRSTSLHALGSRLRAVTYPISSGEGTFVGTVSYRLSFHDGNVCGQSQVSKIFRWSTQRYLSVKTSTTLHSVDILFWIVRYSYRVLVWKRTRWNTGETCSNRGHWWQLVGHGLWSCQIADFCISGSEPLYSS
jgi:hypothetical protein